MSEVHGPTFGALKMGAEILTSMVLCITVPMIAPSSIRVCWSKIKNRIRVVVEALLPHASGVLLTSLGRSKL